MATKAVIRKSLALLGASLNLDIPDATVDAWELVLMEAYDKDLPPACLEVIRAWETGFLPPPAIILAECRKQCHRRMKDLDEEKRQADGMARLVRLKDIVAKGHFP